MRLIDVKPSMTPIGLLRLKAEEIASRRKVALEIMLGRCKSAPVVAARRELAIYLRSLGKTYERVGSLLGRDHSSIRDMVLEGNRTSKYRRLKAERLLAVKSFPAPLENMTLPHER
jgi:hypothetical protein